MTNPEVEQTSLKTEVAVRAVLDHEWKIATEAFHRNPTGDHWASMKEIMAARQFFHQSHGREWARTNLISAGIGSWVQLLARESGIRE